MGNGCTSVALEDHWSLETFFSFWFFFFLQLISHRSSWLDVVMAELENPAQPFSGQDGCGLFCFKEGLFAQGLGLTPVYLLVIHTGKHCSLHFCLKLGCDFSCFRSDLPLFQYNLDREV